MYAKGKGAVSAKYACGGPVVTTKSRFMKSPDVFRGDKQRSDYGGKKDAAINEGSSKKPRIKPQT